jgi:hypothetical protein
VELEAYNDSYDDESGDAAISTVICGNASGGGAVGGLDFAGEWITVSVSVPQSGTYLPYLQYNADFYDSIAFSLEMAECAGDASAELVADQGRGTG